METMYFLIYGSGATVYMGENEIKQFLTACTKFKGGKRQKDEKQNHKL